jgi:hypothetical protein
MLAQRMTRSPPPLDRERTDLPTWVVRLGRSLAAAATGAPVPEARARWRRPSMRRAVPYEFPRERAKRIGGIVALIALVALLFGGAWWWSQRKNPAPPPIAAVPPLQRVLVCRWRTTKDVPGARALAYDAHVLDALAATPGLAVVDGERTDQALRQADAVRAGRYDIPNRHRIAAATACCNRRCCTRPMGMARASDPAHDRCLGHIDRRPRRAQRAGGHPRLAVAPAFRDAMHATASPVLAMPDKERGARRLRRGPGRTAQRATRPCPRTLARATAATPGDPSAWLAQSEAALAIGEQDDAYDALDRGLATPAVTKSPSPTALRLRRAWPPRARCSMAKRPRPPRNGAA